MHNFSKCFVVSMVFALAGCGSMSNFRDIQEAGPTIYVAGSVESIRDAEVIALSERRLDSPQFEKIEKGVIVFAEQSSMAALVFNSYGGFGKVTIRGNNPSGTVEVSAITRSRIPNEPVGRDILKGQNFNDPRVAISILDRINEIAKLKAQ